MTQEKDNKTVTIYQHDGKTPSLGVNLNLYEEYGSLLHTIDNELICGTLDGSDFPHFLRTGSSGTYFVKKGGPDFQKLPFVQGDRLILCLNLSYRGISGHGFVGNVVSVKQMPFVAYAKICNDFHAERDQREKYMQAEIDGALKFQNYLLNEGRCTFPENQKQILLKGMELQKDFSKMKPIESLEQRLLAYNA